MVSKPGGKLGHHVLTVFLGVVAVAIGLFFLWHPIATWAFGVPRRSDAPPVLGVGILVVPVVLLGLAARRAWWALMIDLAVWQERHRRHR